ncbi:MAG: hypothetical protein APR53_10630 [Methanoculleus sp. SDB]|nr:MAG: hypothetical protein APR53_10630 [Methanoculleus sp. SDB]
MSLKITVAAPFRYMRKDKLQKSEFIFFVAIDRRWMSKEEANRLLARAGEEGLLRFEGGVITPAFPVDEVTIPLGFKPSPELLAVPDVFGDLVGRIARARSSEKAAIVAELNEMVQKNFDGLLRAEAAAVILARRYGVPFDDLLDDLKARLVQEK